MSKIDQKKACIFTMFFAFLIKLSKIDNFCKKSKNHAKIFYTHFIFFKKIKLHKIIIFGFYKICKFDSDVKFMNLIKSKKVGS